MTAAETLPGEHDYAIVGASSGGSDRHPRVLAPAGFPKTFRNPRFNRRFETEPGPGGRRDAAAA